MKNKRFNALLLALLLTLSCFILTACGTPSENGGENEGGESGGTNENSGKTYTVTFVDGDNAPIAGLTVKFAHDDNETEAVVTDSNGKASATISTTDTVSVVMVEHEGWDSVSSRKLKFGKYDTELTVELTAIVSIEVKVRLVGSDGASLSGVKVMVCVDTTCAPEVTTDERGEAIINLPISGAMKVKLPDGAPVGYLTPEVDENGYAFFFDEGETELVITLQAE